MRVLAGRASAIGVAGVGFRAAVVVLTPLTTAAGEWLYDELSQPAPILEAHAAARRLDDLLRDRIVGRGHRPAIQHWAESRSSEPKRTLAVVAAVLAIVVGGVSTVSALR